MSDFKEDFDENLTDSSQSSLRTVLVTFRIEKPSAKHIKRVRFNSLVEVKFIPRRRKKEKRKNMIDVEESKGEKINVEDIVERCTDHINKPEHEEKEVGFKDVVSVPEHWVATTTETASANGTEDLRLDNLPQGRKEKVEESTKKSSTSAVETDLSVAKNDENEDVDENSGVTTAHAGVVKSRITVRKSYTTSKITLGTDYIGNALRLSPATFPVAPPIQFSEFPARNARKQHLHELGSKVVWRLEKQAAKFCQEAEALISQVTEKNTHIQSKLKEQSEAVIFRKDYKQTFLNENTRSRKPNWESSLGKLLSHGASYNRHGNTSITGGKLVTRFPYIKKKKKESIVSLNKTSSGLCLPQLPLHERNGTRSPGFLANPDGKRENAEYRDMYNQFERVKQEENQNGKFYISYSYGRTRLGLKPNTSAD